MADNVTANAGSGGATFRTDDDGTAHWPYQKIAFGADNTQNIVASTSSNPLPVALSDTDNAVLDTIDAVLDTINAKLVSGTVIGDVNLGATDNAVLDAIAASVAGTLTVDNGGTFAVQVDGAALTALQLFDDIVYVDDADWTATTSKHGLIGGIYQSTPGTITDGDTGPIRLDANGAIHISDGGNTITVDGTVTANLSATDNAVLDAIAASVAGTLTVDGSGVTQPVSAASLPLPTGAATAANQGTANTALSAIQTAVELIDNAISGSEMQVDIVGSLPAGTNAIGKLAANSGVDIGDVDVTSIAAGSNLIGDVSIQGRATGGASVYYDNDLDETAVAVKGSAGTLYAIHAMNTTAAPLYLQLFNVAQGSVTVGTTTPTAQFIVPGNADSDGAGFTFEIPQGIAFSTAITAAASTNSEGNGAPGANACHVNLVYV